MQSIERYGVVALCFLIVTMVAVWLWDDQVTQAGSPAETGAVAEMEPSGDTGPSPSNAVRVPESRPRSDPERTAPPVTGGAIVAATSDAETGPLSREVLIERRKAEARARLEREKADEEARRLRWEEDERRKREAELESVPVSRPLATSEGIVPATKTSITKAHSKQETRGGLRPYVIRSDDTLSQISERELGTMHRWSEIAAMNPGLNPDRLPVGVEILLPVGEASPPAVKDEAKGTSSGERYVVASGESLWTIAADRIGDGSRWREIALLNPAVDPERLRVGDVLVLPGGAKAPSAEPGPKVANREQARSRTRGKVL